LPCQVQDVATSDALLELGELPTETAMAERWEAAFHLLCAYHYWNPTPDRAFGPPGGDWPLTANAVALPDWVAFSSHDAHLVKLAREPPARMDRLTDWLVPESVDSSARRCRKARCGKRWGMRS